MNSYLSVHDYLRMTTGQETSSLLGNLMRVGTGGVAQGATSLPVAPNTTVNLNQYDLITIFDGASTEVVTVTTNTTSGASSIPISATQFAHAAGISCCSDGASGSLAEAILEGSAEVERICRQPLLQATYTNETVPLQSSRAWIDSSIALGIRPRQAPVTSVSAITLAFSATSTMSLDTSQVQLDAIGRIVHVPVIKSVNIGGNTYPWSQYLDQTTEGEVQITYVAGFPYVSLPLPVRRAAVLLIGTILSDRQNPLGADQLRQGDVQIISTLRGDFTGESTLIKRAKGMLRSYMQEAL
jgi:hypothetical protein